MRLWLRIKAIARGELDDTLLKAHLWETGEMHCTKCSANATEVSCLSGEHDWVVICAWVKD